MHKAKNGSTRRSVKVLAGIFVAGIVLVGLLLVPLALRFGTSTKDTTGTEDAKASTM